MNQKGNGEGTIYFSTNLNRYVAQYTEPYTHKRKTLTQRKNEKTTDFKARFTNIINLINHDTYIKENTISLYDILKEYINNKYKIGITKARTYNRNKETLNLLVKACNNFIYKPVQKITSHDVKTALPNLIESDNKIYSQNIIDKVYALLVKGFQIAISERLIQYNIMDNETITKPHSKKETKKVEALTIEEEKQLINILNNTEHKYNNIILLALYTGMRIGEILALTFNDINKDVIIVNKTLTQDINGKVIIGNTTKTAKGTRTVYLNNAAKDVITKIKGIKITNMYNLVFWDYRKNTFITPCEINLYLQRINNKYHFCTHLHTHMLRHTYATRAIESGMSAKVLQNQLGHKKITTTLDTYTSVFEKFNQDENKKIDIYMNQIGLH